MFSKSDVAQMKIAVNSPHIPDPVLDHTGKHFKTLEAVLGSVTSEKDRPSFRNQTLAAVAQEQQVSTGCLEYAICTVEYT